MPIHAVPSSTPPRAADPLWRQLVGAAVRARRLRSGLRLRDVAERAGISAQYLSEVERGRKDPSSEMLESICGALGMDLIDLVHAVGLRLMRIEVGTGLSVIGTAASPAPVGRLGPSTAQVRLAA